MELMTQVCEFNRAADTGRWDGLGYEAVEAVLREEYGLGGQDGVLLTRVRCAHVTPACRRLRLQALPEPSLAEPLAESEWVAAGRMGTARGAKAGTCWRNQERRRHDSKGIGAPPRSPSPCPARWRPRCDLPLVSSG